MKLIFQLSALACICPLADGAVIRVVSDELPSPSTAQISVTTQSVRGGAAAFRHVTSAKKASAEFKVEASIGDERWYGWSLQLPSEFDHGGRSTVVMRFGGNSETKPSDCPIAGSAIEIDEKGRALFHLHSRDAAGAEPKCRQFPLAANVAPLRGKWIDFVLHAKWSQGSDAFVDLWVKQDDNNYFHVVDHRGPTCVGGETGLEFSIGGQVRAVDQAKADTDVVVFTDELRVGDAQSNFDQVASPGNDWRATEAAPGEIHHVVYPSTLNRRKIPVMVYTPPGYDAKGTKSYPVVYNLHGAGGGSPERQWSRVHATLTGAMKSKAAPPVIYVFVNGLGDTGFIDYPAPGMPKVFSSIVSELIPFIDANYRTIADRRGRGIDGFSMGAGGAMMMATKRPDLFSVVVAYGGGFMPHDPADPNERRRQVTAEFSPYVLVENRKDEIRTGLRIRLVCGDQDKNHADNLKFKSFLEGLNIPVSWVSIPGLGHDTKGSFDRVGVESINFTHEGFGKE